MVVWKRHFHEKLAELLETGAVREQRIIGLCEQLIDAVEEKFEGETRELRADLRAMRVTLDKLLLRDTAPLRAENEASPGLRELVEDELAVEEDPEAEQKIREEQQQLAAAFQTLFGPGVSHADD